MRKLIATAITSLDGYCEGPGKNVMVMPMDGAFDAYNLERMRAADTVLLGHTSYDMFSGFWPTVADQPEASTSNREFSRLYNQIEKVVVAHHLAGPIEGPWRDTTTVISGDDVYGRIAKLKQTPGREIVMYASHLLWNDLLAHGLLDELHLMIGRVALGAGTPLFTAPMAYDDPHHSLHLIDSRIFEGSDNLLAQYAVKYK